MTVQGEGRTKKQKQKRRWVGGFTPVTQTPSHITPVGSEMIFLPLVRSLSWLLFLYPTHRFVTALPSPLNAVLARIVGTTDVCPWGAAFYSCSANGFTGCCTVDPCHLPRGCPETLPADADPAQEQSVKQPRRRHVEKITTITTVWQVGGFQQDMAHTPPDTDCDSCTPFLDKVLGFLPGSRVKDTAALREKSKSNTAMITASPDNYVTTFTLTPTPTLPPRNRFWSNALAHFLRRRIIFEPFDNDVHLPPIPYTPSPPISRTSHSKFWYQRTDHTTSIPFTNHMVLWRGPWTRKTNHKAAISSIIAQDVTTLSNGIVCKHLFIFRNCPILPLTKTIHDPWIVDDPRPHRVWGQPWPIPPPISTHPGQKTPSGTPKDPGMAAHLMNVGDSLVTFWTLPTPSARTTVKEQWWEHLPGAKAHKKHLQEEREKKSTLERAKEAEMIRETVEQRKKAKEEKARQAKADEERKERERKQKQAQVAREEKERKEKEKRKQLAKEERSRRERVKQKAIAKAARKERQRLEKEKRRKEKQVATEKAERERKEKEKERNKEKLIPHPQPEPEPKTEPESHPHTRSRRLLLLRRRQRRSWWIAPAPRG
ncbi:MAG: hypothetical protein M1833_004668 [Piccolia ochrophora]|nr:MAG: hypothetical protein M1833_004668 [Piccolia ochrophora]